MYCRAYVGLFFLFFSRLYGCCMVGVVVLNSAIAMHVYSFD